MCAPSAVATVPLLTSTRAILLFSSITATPGGALVSRAYVHDPSLLGAENPPPRAVFASATVIPARSGPTPCSVTVHAAPGDAPGVAGFDASLGGVGLAGCATMPICGTLSAVVTEVVEELAASVSTGFSFLMVHAVKPHSSNAMNFFICDVSGSRQQAQGLGRCRLVVFRLWLISPDRLQRVGRRILLIKSLLLPEQHGMLPPQRARSLKECFSYYREGLRWIVRAVIIEESVITCFERIAQLLELVRHHPRPRPIIAGRLEHRRSIAAPILEIELVC